MTAEKRTRGYTEKSVVDYLRRSSVDIDEEQKTITVTGVLGIRRLGMIDYLVNTHEYKVLFYNSRSISEAFRIAGGRR